MKSFSWSKVIFAIAIIVAIAILFWNFFKWASKELNDEVSVLKGRLSKIKAQISIDIQNLKLIQDLKNYLDNKIRRIFSLVKYLSLGSVGCVYVAFILNGYNPVDALLTAVGLLSILFVAISLIIVNRVFDTNVLVNLIQLKIQKWIYSKHQFNPARIVQLKETIALNAQQSNDLENEIQSLAAKKSNAI